MIASPSFSTFLIPNMHCLLVHHLWIAKTAGKLKAKNILGRTGRLQFVLGQKITLHRLIIQKCPKPVRKFLKELKRKVLRTMLRFPYCSCMEPALKQCLDPLTLPANPSTQSNGHL